MADQANLRTPLSPVRQYWMPTEQAIEQYLAYEERYGRGHALLACHAAFPLIVTPELVNLIRINFLAEQAIDWVAEADFLLAFCHPLDTHQGLYQIDPGLREVMLADLQESDYRINRLYELADFLLAYGERYAERLQRPDIARVHQLIAWSYLYPQRLIDDMKDTLLAESTRLIDSVELPAHQIHVATMIEVMSDTFEMGLPALEDQYQEVLKRAQVVAYYWYRGDVATLTMSHDDMQRHTPFATSLSNPLIADVTHEKSDTSDLEALTGMMQNESVYSLFAAYQAEFETANQQITLLGHYLDLQDLLHKLQYRCYSVIAQEAQRFPKDELSIDNLLNYEVTLQDISGQLQGLVQQEGFATNEMAWIADVVQAQELLRQALDGLDGEILRRVVWLLRRVLAIHPSDVHHRVSSVARTLRFDTIVASLKAILDELHKIHIDPVRLQQIESSMNEIRSINVRLDDLVEEHDHWLEIQRLTERIEDVIVHDLNELEFSWPSLQEKVTLLCTDRNAEWVQLLLQDSDILNKAISEQNPVRIRSYFQRFRQRVANRFFQVVTNLKEVYYELHSINQKLTSILSDYLGATSTLITVTSERKSSGIPISLLADIRQALLACDEIYDPAQLSAILRTSPLRPFANSLKTANNPNTQVDFLIGDFAERHLSTGENALVLLLKVLGNRYDPADAQHDQLLNLAEALQKTNSAGILENTVTPKSLLTSGQSS